MSSIPLHLPFDSPDATLENAGGKGAALAELARAGLPVPGGFHLTTGAYRRFVTETGAADRIAAVLASTDPADPEATRHAGAAIRPLFGDTAALPADVRSAIAAGLAGLPPRAAVAVRSSATAEDLPDASFAGQMESHLNVRGAEAVEAAVLGCWASLWTDRAIAYRARRSRPGTDDVASAVVIQLMADATASGVAFTADPVTGRRDRTVVNATWGLGESLVGGAVTPDQYVLDGATGAVVSRTIGDKAVETVRTRTGTEERPISDRRRRAVVLDDTALSELHRLTTRVARLHDRPVDVEWTRHDGGFQIVQARPITNLPEPPPAREEWNDSLLGDHLWTSANLGEAIPSVMTPMTWSFVQIFMSEAMSLSHVGPYRLSGNIGGRFYLNLSVSNAVADALGLSGMVRTGSVQAFGRFPGGVTAPPLPLSRWRILRLAMPSMTRFVRGVARYQRNFDAMVAAFPDRCRTTHARIAATDRPGELRGLWDDEIRPLLVDGAKLLAAGSRLKGAAQFRVRAWLSRLVDEADTHALTTGVHTDTDGLASLGPLLGLRQLVDGVIDRETFDRTWGHRCPDEFEVSVPRPAEDPAWVDRALAGMRDAPPVTELLNRQATAREEAMRRFAARHPRKVATLRRRLAAAAVSARGRETGRSEVIRAFWVLRRFVLRAAELTGAGDRVFHLRLSELLALLEGDESVLDRVPAREAAYRHYRALPVYPTFIRGAFDPDSWAADPGRRADLADATGEAVVSDGEITGAAGSPGKAEGVARIVESVDDAGRVAVGEILVTKVTNIGWTPVFPRVAAVVTDVGAALSHAAIVARELGIPAVVGCGDATTRLRDGDRIRVDGDQGTVVVLGEPGAPDPS
ncbi:pyruvate,water dikinase [Stackebrandtia albiflava]|uniref:Pyruvate,water dikinase n=1 Tax=Stackebrandtia albiflava TaxID=406432 RepID=A0A562VCK1_9ACTN|nr:PEP/pyruvate-binding domain-containing protein [Stackebrandtia albiflava]TWJ15578.1 pyruvate,water dikinase [Stackebrandtia albiflava]